MNNDNCIESQCFKSRYFSAAQVVGETEMEEFSKYFDLLVDIKHVESENTNENLNKIPIAKGNISVQYLKENKKKMIFNSEDLKKKTMEEAKNMERIIMNCIKEANIFCEILNKPHRYRLSKRNDTEDILRSVLISEDNDLRTEIPIGTGKRMKKMLVQSHHAISGGIISSFSTNSFMSEHSKLREEVKKKRSTLPAFPSIAHAVDHSDILEKVNHKNDNSQCIGSSVGEERDFKSIIRTAKFYDIEGGLNGVISHRHKSDFDVECGVRIPYFSNVSITKELKDTLTALLDNTVAKKK